MGEGFLFDIKAIELADEKAEFCGRLLAGAGADVLKIEPPEGSPTRKIGPFVDDVPDPERSLHFWHYNFGKQSLALDVATPAGAERLKELAAGADVLLESHPPGYLASLGLGYDTLSAINPRLVMASITPFGQTGPWKDWKGADIVHLALGGVMMVTGYDPTPDGFYDTPPIAPQMWHANHIVGSQALDAILGALLYRERTGRGQHIDASIHRAVSCNTGTDTTAWVFGRQGVLRQTARYGSSRMVPETLATTKDGRHILAFVSAEFMIGREHKKWVEMLEKYGCADDLTDPKYENLEYVMTPEVIRHFHAVARTWVGKFKFDRDIWKEGQERRLHWAPIRKPEENLKDLHWRERTTFTEVEHEELGRSVSYVNAPWLSEECPWRTGPRAPRLGEHDPSLVTDLEQAGAAPKEAPAFPGPRANGDPPFAIEDVRILDLAWVVAGAAGPRILAAMGAQDIRVEWKGRYDTMRSFGGIPVGEERERVLRGESLIPTRVGVNAGAGFAEVNPGKMSIGLNLNDPKGAELLLELVKVCDVVVENFTARMLERFGVTYEDMRKVNPSIIYVQQPGFGKRGKYIEFLSSAPVGEAFSGLTEMAGMPTPYPPSGWGYLYLDWSASYYCAMAMLNALYYRARTGKGQYIDGSLGEPGLLAHRHRDARLPGQRAAVAAHRQRLALEARRAPRRLPVQGRRPLDRHRRLHRRRVAGRRRSPRPRRARRRGPLRHAGGAPEEPARPRRRRRGRHASLGRLRPHGAPAERGRRRRRLPERPRPHRARPAAPARRVDGPRHQHRGRGMAHPPVPHQALRDAHAPPGHRRPRPPQLRRGQRLRLRRNPRHDRKRPPGPRRAERDLGPAPSSVGALLF